MNLSRGALALFLALAAGSASAAASPPSGNFADDPKFTTKDPHEVVITDIEAWSHPTKAVFKKYNLKLTKVELMWNKTFPVFHVTAFGADPGAKPADSFFAPLVHDLLKANGNNAYKIVEDSVHDGFIIAYDKHNRGIDREMVQDEDP